MSLYDKKYLSIVEDILNNGYYDNNRTGMPTYKLPHQIMQFNLEKEFPILTTKFVAFKTAVKEMLWIYRDQSNDVTKLQEQFIEEQRQLNKQLQQAKSNNNESGINEQNNNIEDTKQLENQGQ